MVRALSYAIVMLAACSTKHSETRDAAIGQDAPEIDAALIDAALDAPPDAPPDARPDTPPMSTCMATVSVLVDVAPSRVFRIARVADTLYIGAYDYDQVTGDSNSRVLVYDLTTGMPVGAPIPFQSRPALWAGVGEAWVTDQLAGSLWRLRPGMSPEQVVTGRPVPGAVVADGGYVYWSEAVPPSNQQTVVQRRLITGGTVEPVTSCNTPEDLIVAGNDIYCGEFQSANIKRAPKAGGTAVSITSSGYPLVSMTGDATDLYYLSLKPTPETFRVPIPNGPQMLVNEMMGLPSRYSGIALSSTYIYLVGDGGVRRINRATQMLETSINSTLCAEDPVLWNNEIVFVKKDSQVLRCVD